MGKAEVGSAKHLSNQMKARGLTRLRWYCQVCERAMRDENAFKQHTMSESHVRKMMDVGADPRKAINEYSNQFLKDFLQLLRTGHGEKQVQLNHFYQEYIAKRDHIHMNATRWSSLTELAKYLGREGICRVDETEKGLFIAWIDTSPEALRRQEALRRKEAQDRGDEEWERRMLQAQIARAEKMAEERRKRGGGGDEAKGDEEQDEEDEEKNGFQRQDGEKIKISFGSIKPAAKPATSESTSTPKPAEDHQPSSEEKVVSEKAEATKKEEEASAAAEVPPAAKPAAAKPMAFKMGGVSKPQAKNVFSAARKKLAQSGSGSGTKKIEAPQKMSEVERIMKEEMERKRSRGSSGSHSRFDGSNKKPRF